MILKLEIQLDNLEMPIALKLTTKGNIYTSGFTKVRALTSLDMSKQKTN